MTENASRQRARNRGQRVAVCDQLAHAIKRECTTPPVADEVTAHQVRRMYVEHLP